MINPEMKAIYKIQDLMIENNISTFETFYVKTYKYFESIWKKYHKKNDVSRDQVEKIYTFVDTIKYHPQKIALFNALIPMFKMLFLNIITQTCAKVYHEKFDKYYFVNYDNIFSTFGIKKIFLMENNLFVIPYRKRISRELTYQIINMVEYGKHTKLVRDAYNQLVSRYGRFISKVNMINYLINHTTL